eukprot:scaffold268_cov236-Pinguiococcus_pyrenoidosus.AAC.4
MSISRLRMAIQIPDWVGVGGTYIASRSHRAEQASVLHHWPCSLQNIQNWASHVLVDSKPLAYSENPNYTISNLFFWLEGERRRERRQIPKAHLVA